MGLYSEMHFGDANYTTFILFFGAPNSILEALFSVTWVLNLEREGGGGNSGGRGRERRTKKNLILCQTELIFFSSSSPKRHASYPSTQRKKKPTPPHARIPKFEKRKKTKKKLKGWHHPLTRSRTGREFPHKNFIHEKTEMENEAIVSRMHCKITSPGFPCTSHFLC